MIAPAIPADELQRLTALAALDILDTPAEERYDRIVRLAQKVLSVPIAYLSFVDEERQWLKSRVGMPVCETARDISFCGHAILQREPLVIPDARNDPRFADNPMVVGEPFIRFYVGIPLASPDGFNVGTLCVADSDPRTIEPDQLRMLQDFAALVEREFTLVDVIDAQGRLLGIQTELAESRAHLASELARAARYVESLLPDPDRLPLPMAYRYVPSAHLGGDVLDAFTLPDGRVALYVLDVAGHGVGSALLSVSAMNVLRAGALPANLGEPAAVLKALNCAFPMHAHDNKHFTVWYGVLDPADRTLLWAGGGHPPAVVTGNGSSPLRLGSTGPLVGALPSACFEQQRATLPAGALLWVFSDGAYEIFPADDAECDRMFGFDALTEVLASTGDGPLDGVITRLHEHRGNASLDDDLSLLRVVVP